GVAWETSRRGAATTLVLKPTPPEDRRSRAPAAPSASRSAHKRRHYRGRWQMRSIAPPAATGPTYRAARRRASRDPRCRRPYRDTAAESRRRRDNRRRRGGGPPREGAPDLRRGVA